jgi:chaperone LolA
MRIALAICLLASIASADDKKPKKPEAKPPQLLVDMQAAYAKAQHLTSSFTQTITRAIGKDEISTGTLSLARPDKMRWEYVDKKGKLKRQMIFDGKKLWVVEPQNKRIYEHATTSATLPAAVSFLNGGDALVKEFTVTTPSADTLELVPKETSAKIKKLTFVVDAKTKQVVKSIVLDHQGDTNTFEFAKVDVTTAPDAKLFTFDPKSQPTWPVTQVN